MKMWRWKRKCLKTASRRKQVTVVSRRVLWNVQNLEGVWRVLMESEGRGQR